MSHYGFIAGAWLLASLPAFGQNLLKNGDFEQGKTGFSSSYDYHNNDTMVESTYAVVRSPREANHYGADFPDHTSGAGYLLVVNGSPTANKVFWSQKVAIEPDQHYVFSGWVCSWGMDWQLASKQATGTDPAPSKIRVAINGQDCGEVIPVPAANGVWLHFSVSWDSGNAASAKIELRTLTTARDGNDFAVDDLTFAQADGNEPASASAAGAAQNPFRPTPAAVTIVSGAPGK